MSVRLLVEAVVERDEVDVPVFACSVFDLSLVCDVCPIELPWIGGWDIPGGKEGEEGEWNWTGKFGERGEVVDVRKGDAR